jgi:hypothetical protein
MGDATRHLDENGSFATGQSKLPPGAWRRHQLVADGLEADRMIERSAAEVGDQTGSFATGQATSAVGEWSRRGMAADGLGLGDAVEVDAEPLPKAA